MGKISFSVTGPGESRGSGGEWVVTLQSYLESRFQNRCPQPRKVPALKCSNNGYHLLSTCYVPGAEVTPSEQENTEASTLHLYSLVLPFSIILDELVISFPHLSPQMPCRRPWRGTICNVWSPPPDCELLKTVTLFSSSSDILCLAQCLTREKCPLPSLPPNAQ